MSLYSEKVRAGFERLILVFLENLHAKIFKSSMSIEMGVFIGKLSWSFIGGASAAFIVFSTNIIAGRWLGPEGYGEYQSLLSIASSVAVFFLLGMNTSCVRYLSDKTYKEQQKDIFTTTVFFVIASSIFWFFIFLIFQKYILNVFAISKEVFIFAICLAFFISLKDIANSFLRSFQKIKSQAVIRFIDAVLVFLAFLFLFQVVGIENKFSLILATVAGATFFVVYSFFLLRQYFFKINIKLFIKIFSDYNIYVLVGSVLGTFVLIDKFLIGRFVGYQELGIYSAYYVSSHIVVAEIGAVFMNVFWPALIKNISSQDVILNKIFKIFILFSPVWILLIMLSTTITFLLFGSQYPINIFYVAFFSINAFLGVLLSLYMSFLNIYHIKKSLLYNAILFLFSFLVLLIFKDVKIYIITQILLQIAIIYFVYRKLILKNTSH